MYDSEFYPEKLVYLNLWLGVKFWPEPSFITVICAC